MGLFVVTIKCLGNSLFAGIITKTVRKKKKACCWFAYHSFFEIWFCLREKMKDLIFMALQGHVCFFHLLPFVQQPVVLALGSICSCFVGHMPTGYWVKWFSFGPVMSLPPSGLRSKLELMCFIHWRVVKDGVGHIHSGLAERKSHAPLMGVRYFVRSFKVLCCHVLQAGKGTRAGQRGSWWYGNNLYRRRPLHYWISWLSGIASN